MLLNRKRINRWAKIGAALLAFVFAVSFVGLGVGSGLDANWMDLWRGSGSSGSAAAKSPQDQIKEYEALLAQEPNNYDALLGIANQYGALDDTVNEAAYLERAAAVRESTELYRRLAVFYLNPDSRNDQAAVRVLNKATSLDPNDAQSFLQLGAAQRNLGNTSAAILAWNRYLELQPDGDMAETVKQQIDQLTGQGSTTTTAGATTSTTE